jgi:hypothetical protein
MPQFGCNDSLFAEGENVGPEPEFGREDRFIFSGFLIRPSSEAASPSQIFHPCLPSSLVRLELLAQPVVAFPSKGIFEDNASQSIAGGSEKEEDKDEPAKRVLDFSFFAHAIFSAINKSATKSLHDTKPTTEEKGGANSKLSQQTSSCTDDGESGKGLQTEQDFFDSVPPYLFSASSFSTF